jgi:hypothetical protein
LTPVRSYGTWYLMLLREGSYFPLRRQTCTTMVDLLPNPSFFSASSSLPSSEPFQVLFVPVGIVPMAADRKICLTERHSGIDRVPQCGPIRRQGLIANYKRNNINSNNALDEFAMAGSIPLARRSPEQRATNLDNTLNWLRYNGKDDDLNDPAGEFRKLDSMLPKKRGQTFRRQGS